VHTHPGLAEPRTKEEWRAYLDDVPPERPAVPSYDEYLALPDLLDEVVDDVPVVAGESGDEARDVVLSLHRQRRQLQCGAAPSRTGGPWRPNGERPAAAPRRGANFPVRPG